MMNLNKTFNQLQESPLSGRFFLIILFALSFTGQAQSKYTGLPSLVWPKLYDIKFEKAKDNLGEYDKPIFSQAAKSLEGKMVTLPGYMNPFEKGSKGTTFMLSSLPINACFFCGVGGPESVVEVILKSPISFSEKPIEIKGILRLNYTDPDRMIYRIEQAEYLGEVEF
ncbi:MAG TPA: hypothetical protein VFU05_11680 [Cyclobacteriaceae bacterium]|nr:hypothetical protein [Cyclobacteriaceae bacterium]